MQDNTIGNCDKVASDGSHLPSATLLEWNLAMKKLMWSSTKGSHEISCSETGSISQLHTPKKCELIFDNTNEQSSLEQNTSKLVDYKHMHEHKHTHTHTHTGGSLRVGF